MFTFSMLILSGIVKTHLYPLTAAHIATPRPVLPEVFSTMVPPGRTFPDFSASLRMCRAIRSLMEPVGFMNSHLTRMVAAPGGTTLLSFTRGVLPTASRMVFLIFTGGLGCGGHGM